MATTTSINAETALQIKRVIKAPREKVFQAWTDPEQMKHWCAPTDDFKTAAQIDLRVGGKYRIQMTDPSGSLHIAVGEYKEVVPPGKLVFTWSWEDGHAEDTLVTLEFRDQRGATEVTLTHERFPSAESRDKHNQGWAGCLSRLERLLQG
jgi:uncharacterized protein YndB with AHSA1/START domain